MVLSQILYVATSYVDIRLRGFELNRRSERDKDLTDTMIQSSDTNKTNGMQQDLTKMTRLWLRRTRKMTPENPTASGRRRLDTTTAKNLDAQPFRDISRTKIRQR